jgi:hypothetical protein
MGMLGQLAAKKAGRGYDSASSTGTASFPVTGFPKSAYLGNNRAAGGGSQGRANPVGAQLGSTANYSSTHLLVTLAVLIAVGYLLWHLDNK